MPGLSAYQTSKLAVTRLSEFICAEYGDKGIVSFAAHPGGVPTATSANMGEAFQSQLNDTPELCAGTFVWLLKVRREWLGGRYVSVNMDVGELEGMRERIVEEDLLKVRLAH